jgi:hypothetical protein
MVATGFQGMVDQTPSHQMKMSECHPCPRTFVTYVSGLYTQAKEVTRQQAKKGFSEPENNEVNNLTRIYAFPRKAWE